MTMTARLCTNIIVVLTSFFLIQRGWAELTLDAVLLDSIVPATSDFCKSHYRATAKTGQPESSTTTFTFEHSPSPSYWDKMSASYESELFLAEMSHVDPDSNSPKSWTLRVGQGSNVYSFRSPGFDQGEAIPPQWHNRGPYMDEVQQCVTINQLKNRNSGRPYFIHQAGIYQNDDPYVTEGRAFFSPNLAKHCEPSNADGGGRCSFGSWGQQAHLRTIHESGMLYFNAYTDCGDGVIEFTSVMHNAGNTDGDPIQYINIPWGGVRTSTLRDIYVSNTEQKLEHLYPFPNFFVADGSIQDNSMTGGFISFAEQTKVPDDVFKETFDMPCVDPSTGGTITCPTEGFEHIVLNLKVGKDNPFAYSAVHSDQFRGYCGAFSLSPTVFEKRGCRNCRLWFTNMRNQEKMYVPVVIHWSWGGDIMYFCPVGVEKDEINAMFKKDDEILVTNANFGKPLEDNRALTYVYGVNDSPIDERWVPTRLRYGTAGDHRRDYTVYTVNSRVYVNPGDTYVYRQFMMTGNLTEVETTAPLWVDHVYQDLFSEGEMESSSRSIELYSVDDQTFGAHVVSDTNIACGQGVKRCEGWSVPTPNAKALYAIECPASKYVGSDLYHFAPTDGTTIRAYACDGEDPSVRPTWKLLGYFEEGACGALQTASYDPTFCEAPANLESAEQSASSSEVPSSVLSNDPSIVLSNMPSYDSSVGLSESPSEVPFSATSLAPSPTASDDPTKNPTPLSFVLTQANQNDFEFCSQGQNVFPVWLGNGYRTSFLNPQTVVVNTKFPINFEYSVRGFSESDKFSLNYSLEDGKSWIEAAVYEYGQDFTPIEVDTTASKKTILIRFQSSSSEANVTEKWGIRIRVCVIEGQIVLAPKLALY